MKKFKGHFSGPSTRPPVQPVQPVTARAVALVVRVEHWTPKGDCTKRGDKERYRNDGKQRKKLKNDQKKVHQKIEIIFNFI